MLIYNLIKERLIDCGFSHIELEWARKFEIVPFKNNHINVFLRAYDKEIEIENIIKDTIELRSRLENISEYNVWNSYMIICPLYVADSYLDLVMNVEKDTSALRKYIICEEEDLNRIPFLDITNSDSSKPKKISEYQISQSEEIKDLVSFIQEVTLEEGGKISSVRLKKILEAKFLKEGEIYENK